MEQTRQADNPDGAAPQDEQAQEQGATTDVQTEPDGAAPRVPDAQPGDVPDEVSKPVAQPVLQSLDAGKAELAEFPGRASALTTDGHLVREG